MESQCLDTHLNSALSNTILHECVDHVIGKNKGSFRNRIIQTQTEQLKELINHSHLDLLSPDLRYDTQELNNLLMRLSFNGNLNTHNRGLFDKYWDAIMSYVPYHLLKLGLNKAVEEWISQLDKLKEHPHFGTLIYLHNMRTFWEKGICLSSKPRSKLPECIPEGWNEWEYLYNDTNAIDGFKGVFDSKNGDLTVFLSKNHVIIQHDGKRYLASRNHALMIGDLFSERFLVVMSCILAEIFDKPNYPSCESVLKMFTYGDVLLETYGNQAFNTLCLWEPLITAVVLKSKPDPVINNLAFFQEIVGLFVNSQEESDVDILKELLFSDLIPWLEQVDINRIFQLFGLYRLWGHPTIDEIKSVIKLKSVACKHRALNYSFISLVTCKWREYFCLNYYLQHRKWPQMIIASDAPDTTLIKALKFKLEVSPRAPGYRLEDWNYVTFQKTFEVPEKFELSEMIADKATSLGLEDLIQACKDNGTIGFAYLRSVILQWLNTDYNNPAEFLEKIDKHGFDKNELCVGVHPKERELKILARLFGLLTIEKRLYVVITEAMLADHIFKYFPEITMTFDSITLNTRIHTNTLKLNKNFQQSGKENKSKTHTVVVNMDFNKWNSYMRKEETYQIFQDFDHLFGFTNLYTRTHDMFQLSMMYLADGTITPFDVSGKIVKSEGIWFDHLGGIEGLRQKGWTIFTVVILKYISEMHNLECQIMGQGDNQVLIIDYPLDEYEHVKIKHDNFMRDLSSILSHIGPPIKLEETWSSSSFFIYGKFPVYEGRPMSMSLKKLSRMMRLTNEGFQNLESTLSSITANASAATASDYDPIISYIVGSFETVGAIDLHTVFPFYSRHSYQLNRNSFVRVPASGVSMKYKLDLSSYNLDIINKRSLCLLTLISNYPCVLGGYPTLQLCDLMNHGFPDPLSLNIWSLYNFCQSLPEDKLFFKMKIAQMLNPVMNNTVNYEMLCQDPTSLNLIHSSSGNDKLKRLVFEFLTTQLNVKNKHFLTFLTIAKRDQKEISEILSTMNPLNPRVANSILSSTIVGRAMKIVSKINKTSTIIGLMLRYNKRKQSSLDSNLTGEFGEEIYSQISQRNIPDMYGHFEENYYKSVLYGIFKHRNSIDLEKEFCSTKWSQQLRCLSWRKEITGVTVAVPQEFLTWTPYCVDGCINGHHPYPKCGYILVRSDINISLFRQFSFNPLNLPLGPFKPFFGSNTKNKVQYEGGELKKIAPPIMEGALDMLCLIGWGTKHDSNLTKLIKAIFNSFTDLSPECCIPDVATLTGSVEHRWQDKRTSHYSSLSILYLLATHVTINTNGFKPELLPQNEGNQNFNVSFQTIFTWISCIWSAKILNAPKNLKSSYHLHISCPTCIQPIYEGFLEIEDSEAISNILVSSVDKTNPYCWVPKEKLIDSVMLCSSELSIRRNGPLDNEELDYYLPLSAADFYLINYPSVISDSYLFLKMYENPEIIPVSVALTLPLIDFIINLQTLRIVNYVFLRSKFLQNRLFMGSEDLYTESVRTLNDVPSSWFLGMLTVLLNHNTLNDLRKYIPNLELPSGTPSSSLEKSWFFKELVHKLTTQILSITEFIKNCDKLSNKFVFITKSIFLNPLILQLVIETMSGDISVRKLGFGCLSLIRDIHCESRSDLTLNSNSDLYKICLKSGSNHKLRWALPHMKSVRDKIKQNKLSGRILNLEMLSKLNKGRSRPINVLDVQGHKFNYSNFDISLNNLDIAYKLIMTITSSSNPIQQTSIVLEPRRLTTTKLSYINHFYKRNHPITTGAYKILSILHSIHISLEKNVRNETDELIICLGDGAGGYTSVCGRIFSNCKLYYNTLFEINKLSSIGIDNYVPSILGMFPTIIERLEGLTETTEYVSDLTSNDFKIHLNEDIRKVSLIICDAEGSTWENPTSIAKLTENLIILALANRCGLLVIKSYAANLGLLYLQIQILSGVFNTVRILRSYFSTHGNSEIFLVAEDIKENVRKCQVAVRSSNLKQNEFIIELGASRHQILSYDDFTLELNKTEHFEIDCSLIYPSYSLALDIPEWRVATKDNLVKWVDSFKSGGKILFPTNLIYCWRLEFNLVRFTSRNVSRFKLNFLSKSVVIKMIYEYWGMISLLINSEEDFELWVNGLKSFYIIIYASIDKSWSMKICKTDLHFGSNSKSYKISDLISDSKFKEMCTLAGRLQEIKPQICIDYLNKSLIDPEVLTADQKYYWWREINKSIFPLGFTPITKKVRNSSTQIIEESEVLLSFPIKPNNKSKMINALAQSNLDIEDLQNDGLIKFRRPGSNFLSASELNTLRLTREYLSVKGLFKKRY